MKNLPTMGLWYKFKNIDEALHTKLNILKISFAVFGLEKKRDKMNPIRIILNANMKFVTNSRKYLVISPYVGVYQESGCGMTKMSPI